MRILHVAAALQGALALIMLAAGRHAFPAAEDTIAIAGFVQLASAAAGLAIAARPGGSLKRACGGLILAGALVFAGAIYLGAAGLRVPLAAPLGGLAMIGGWLALAAARPE